jgi:hypothetical protein
VPECEVALLWRNFPLGIEGTSVRELVCTPCMMQLQPADCGVSECGLETSKRRQARPDLACCATGREKNNIDVTPLLSSYFSTQFSPQSRYLS